MMFSFAPIEPVPSVDTLAKLFLTNHILFADNLIYNKRLSYNQIEINSETLFSIPISKNHTQYRLIKTDNNHNWKSKFIHILEKQFAHYDYAPFILSELIQQIKISDDYFNLHEFWISLFKSFKHFNTKVEYASEYSDSFDIVEISKHHQNKDLYVDKNYSDYLTSKNISHHILNYRIQNPELYSDKNLSNCTSLMLIFEFGPYLNRLFKFA